jgi:hypothetical protein
VVSDSLPAGLTLAATNGWITGIPTVSTNATFCVRVTGADTLFSTNSFSLTINASAYGSWRVGSFTAAELASPAISGDLASPARDGIPNWLKYAMGLAPKTTNSASEMFQVAARPQVGYLTLTYRQNKQATDISFITEASDSLTAGSWNTDGLQELSRVDSNTYWSVTVRDGVSLANAVSRFLRLTISRP